MTVSSDKQASTEDDSPRRRLVPHLLVELIIGLGIAALLVLVGWASSNAIRFVYGGY